MKQINQFLFLRPLWNKYCPNHFQIFLYNFICSTIAYFKLMDNHQRRNLFLLNISLLFRFMFNRLMPVVGILLTVVLAITVPVSQMSFYGFVALLWLGYFLAFIHFSTIPAQVYQHNLFKVLLHCYLYYCKYFPHYLLFSPILY